MVQADNQCQVIIGNTVSHAYREVLALLPQGGQDAALPPHVAGACDAWAPPSSTP